MPSDEPTLGAALRAAREASGKTVEQVADLTRIRATLIRDLEDDKFGSSMGAVYARGHVKSIATAVGADPGPLLALFDKVNHAEPGPSIVEVAAATAPSGFDGSAFAASAAALRPERRAPLWGTAIIGAAVVLVLLMAIGLLQGSPKRPVATLLGSPSPSPSASAQQQVQTPAPDSVASKPAVVGAQLRVRLIGGQSWVSVSNGTTTLFEGILHDGEFKDFTDPLRLKIVIGNAQPVDLNCDGHDSGPAGAAGQVKRFSCTPSGLTAL